MGGLAFYRSLPGWARRLWLLIVVVLAVELAVTIFSLIWAPGWLWLTTEVFSLSVWPLAGGVALVVLVGLFQGRRRAAGSAPVRESSPPTQPPPAGRGAEREGIEVAAGRTAARLWAQASRRPEGQAAIRRTGRLARAVRAAARPPDGEEDPGDPPRDRAEDR